ncbi:MAG: KH domain-containing protein [Erysipelotrichia bacterium]|nr:KH domain-containing protein [Erysipelotrichia bacterium]
MEALDQVLLNLVKPMVNSPEDLSVSADEGSEDDIVLHVHAKADDVARLIGRKGMMASALRQVMLIASRSEDKRVSIKFEQID